MLGDKENLTVIGGNMPESKREIEENILEVLSQWYRGGISLSRRMVREHFELTQNEVTYYLKQMIRHGYVEVMPDEDVFELTDFGKIQGEECFHRHESLTQFLQMIGLDTEEAQEDACRIEHVIRGKAVKGIENFIHYGDIYERTVKNADLRYKYELGQYEFLMCIYNLGDRYPRKMAVESKQYSDKVLLHITEDESGFLLIPRGGEKRENVWYRMQEKWQSAEEREEGIWIPTQAFNFTMSPGDPMMEGYLITAFLPEWRQPTERDGRELNVHIW